MWYENNQKPSPLYFFDYYEKIYQKDPSEENLQRMVAAYYRENLGFAAQQFFGVKPIPTQEILLHGMFAKDNSLIVASRGFGKSYLLALFAGLYGVMNPGSKIVIIANNFRRARAIFEQLEKNVARKEAFLIDPVFNWQKKGPKAKRADEFKWSLSNGSVIGAYPLANGSGLRGIRANLLIIDEGLLISEQIETEILIPFLSSVDENIVHEQAELNQMQDELIAMGAMKAEDKISLSRNKFVMMSSASYGFEYLHKRYQTYLENIKNAKPDAPSYLVSRVSYKAIENFSVFDKNSVQKAIDVNGEDNPVFRKEWMAEFVDTSGGFFKLERLHQVKTGDLPSLEIVGKKNARYLLSIDPSWAASDTSDYFAMGLYLLNEEEEKITLVHQYARAGADLIEHFHYLSYILTCFNVVHLIIDADGTTFIDGFNNSELAKNNGICLKYYDVNFEHDKYEAEIRKALDQKYAGAKVYAQQFTGPSIRKMNELLRLYIDKKKIWLGSSLASEQVFKLAIANLPIVADAFGEKYNATTADKPQSFLVDKSKRKMTFIEWIEDQDDLLDLLKGQLAQIHVSITASGVQRFDLPKNLKKSDSPDRVRRDNYTAMLLANYGAKHYFDMVNYAPPENANQGFTPFILE